jgi:ATP-dependent Clp protease ATP-binding subunit ClpB
VSAENFEEVKKRVLDLVRESLRPEFINRLDEIIVFRQLGVHQIKEIVQIQLRLLASRLEEKRIALRLTDAAAMQIATAGYDPVYGARPLKRAIQKEVLNPLANSLLRGEIVEGEHVLVDYRDGRFVFEEDRVVA